jgi:alpha-ribazole phosphatase
MSEVTRLLLIRHARPSEEARGRCYGRLGTGLSAGGRRQARLLARALGGVPLAAVCSSPSRRAIETAAPLAALCQLKPIVDAALREIDFGDLEGHSYAEIERSHPQLYQQWMQAPASVQFPGGESYAALRLRALEAIGAIRARYRGQPTAVVTHGGIVRAILADCLAMPGRAIFNLDLSFGGVSIVDWIDGVPLVRLVNGQPAMAAAGRRGYRHAFSTPTAGAAR